MHDSCTLEKFQFHDLLLGITITLFIRGGGEAVGDNNENNKNNFSVNGNENDNM